MIAATILAFAAGAVRAAEPAAPVDAELLEFLGSLDSEDEEWHEYLAARPVRAAAGKPAGKPAEKAVAKSPQTGGPEPQQEKVKQP
jgi:hypothetical protein